MRVMVFVKATPDSEKGLPPTAEMTKMFEAMGKFNTLLIDNGIMVSGDGLTPSSLGKRVLFDGESRTVTDGPFAETKEVVAGYWVWQVKDMDEAVAWVKRCPQPDADQCVQKTGKKAGSFVVLLCREFIVHQSRSPNQVS